MSELDPLDKRLNMAWQALSPPDGLAGRVLVRLSSASGTATQATLAGRVSSRWRSLRASGPLGASIGGLLLGLGLALGYLIPRGPVDESPPPIIATVPAQPTLTDASSMQPLSMQHPSPPASARQLDVTPTGATDTSPGPSSGTPAPASSALTASSALSRSRSTPSAPPRVRTRGGEPSARSANDPGAELLLLERAERAVRAKNPALALVLIAEHEQRYPSSPLHEERRSIEVMAHCQARGAGADTTARLEGFLRRYTDSVYSARIAAECGHLGFAASTDKRRPAGH